MPLSPWLFDPDRWDFDICFAQTTSPLARFGVWLRRTKGTALLCVNTTHLAAAYDVLLPERLSKLPVVHETVDRTLKRPYENLFRDVYNESDGLIVLSNGLKDYWAERGVRVPIYVIPRVVAAEVFERPLGADPYEAHLRQAGLSPHAPRVLCAGRHTREKSQDRVIRIFANQILPREPEAILALVGNGPDTEFYRRQARELGVGGRVIFTGEVPHGQMPDYYRYADVFAHASLSETYGNVLGEALWCGMPTVAMADGMGTSFQIAHGVNGRLVDPHTPTEAAADAAFGNEVVALLRNPEARRKLAHAARQIARERSSKLAVETCLAKAFDDAQQRVAKASSRRSTVPKRVGLAATLSQLRPWAAVLGGVYLAGHLRRPTQSAPAAIQPKLGV
jgi:glycosyltransferase involved in cell wall biosynthesis